MTTFALFPAGTVFVVSTGDNWVARLIRLGERLRGLPSLHNHVAVMHHYDNAGVPWGVEGRPGGVGWVDLRGYLARSDTTHNADQTDTMAGTDQTRIAHAVEQMLGRPYDWVGIAGDACRDLNLPDLFARNWDGKGAPGHVVCSSLAAYVYRELGYPAPVVDGAERLVEPGDWDQFISGREWLP